MSEAVIGLIGVIVGSAITISKDVWLSWLERRREGSYSAIRLVCILEEYADKCIDVVYDDGTTYGQPAGRMEDGQSYLDPQVTIPAPLEYPNNISWRSIQKPVMHRALALSNKARSTNRHISAASDHASPPDYEEVFEARQEGYAQLGLDSLEIADDLRKKFDISVMSRSELNSDWEPAVFLKATLSTFAERRAKALNDRSNKDLGKLL